MQQNFKKRVCIETKSLNTSGNFLNKRIFVSVCGSLIIFIVLVCGNFLSLKKEELSLGLFFGYLADSFGWFYLTSVAFFLAVCVFFILTPYGNTTLGRKNEPPEFSKISWISMIFAAGMGLGLTFWSVAEPLIHFVEPPILLMNDHEQKRLAFRAFFVHWGFNVWSIYAIMGVIFAYFESNKHSGSSSNVISSLLKNNYFLSSFVDMLVIWAGLFGIVTTLGLGALQISSGICSLVGTINTKMITATIVLVLTVCFALSSITGIRYGIRYLSLINVFLMVLILGFFLSFGPLKYILETFFHAMIDYILNTPSLFMPTSPYGNPDWTKKWTVFHWATWISWSPIVGSFVAKISKGRTIRELIINVILLPSLFSFVFVSIIGGTSFYFELFKGATLCKVALNDAPVAWFELLKYMPFVRLSILISCLFMMIFFITSADSGIFSICQFILGIDNKSSIRQRKGLILLLSFLVAFMTITLIFIDGLNALKTAALISSLPLLFVVVLSVIVFLKKILNS